MGVFAALDQRIATRFTIKPMDLAESASYLRHHLQLAGRDAPLFADDAIARLHRVSNGLPRALNNAAVRPSSPPRPPAATSSMTPARRKPSPSSPGTDPAPPAGGPQPGSPASAGLRRCAGGEPADEAGSRRARASRRRPMGPARRHLPRSAAAGQQAKLDALLQETIAALASLFTDDPAAPRPDSRPSASHHQQDPAGTWTSIAAERCANNVADNTGPAPTAFNRAGEKFRRPGRAAQGLTRGRPLRQCGLALPVLGEEGQGHPQRCGRMDALVRPPPAGSGGRAGRRRRRRRPRHPSWCRGRRWE